MLMRRTSRSGLGVTLGLPDNLSEAKAQWCIDFPFFCSAATVAASKALLNPDLYYPSLPVSAQGASTSQIDYNNPVSSLATGCQDDPMGCVEYPVTEQTIANQAANLLTMQAAPNALGSSLPTWFWVVLAGMGGLFLLKTVRP